MQVQSVSNSKSLQAETIKFMHSRTTPRKRPRSSWGFPSTRTMRLVVVVFIATTNGLRVSAFAPVGTMGSASVYRISRRNPRRARRAPAVGSTDVLFAAYDAEWQVGDVYRDLERLEQAINISNADVNLQYAQRIETLDYFAAQRRPLAADLAHSIGPPLGFSVTLWLWFYWSPLPRTCRRFVRTLNHGLAAHFMCAAVLAPILALLVQQWRRHPEPLPTELQGIDPEYYRFTTTTWEDPKTSCRNFILCLLEQWTSVVLGFALCGPFLTSTTALPVRMITRTAIVASLRQYPQLWFEFSRSQQPLPLSGSVWLLRTLLAAAAVVYTPWFLAAEAALWMHAVHLPLARVALVYGTMAILAYAPRYLPPSVKIRDGSTWNKVVSLRKYVLFAGVVAVFLPKVLPTLQRARSAAQWIGLPNVLRYQVRQISRTSVLAVAGMGLVLAAPCVHLAAVCRLVWIGYTHDFSLATDADQLQALLRDESDATQSRYQWRYRLRWRPPERIAATLNQWRKRFWYWFFFAGSVPDKLRREYGGKRQSEAHRQGLTVLQRVQEEQRKDPYAPKPDSTRWKSRAMERLAEKHQRDYDSGSFEVRFRLTSFCRLCCNTQPCIRRPPWPTCCMLLLYVPTGSAWRGGAPDSRNWSGF